MTRVLMNKLYRYLQVLDVGNTSVKAFFFSLKGIYYTIKMEKKSKLYFTIFKRFFFHETNNIMLHHTNVMTPNHVSEL